MVFSILSSRLASEIFLSSLHSEFSGTTEATVRSNIDANCKTPLVPGILGCLILTLLGCARPSPS